ncbi:hypothetical protein Taro_010364, partial [Colocasia esculenta]|nr:hypothetical protein [Colocasia esculenta]
MEELLVAEELWNDHKKPFFFPFSSAATCTNHSLEVDQRCVRDPRRVSSMKAATLLDAILTFPRFAGFHCT